MPVISDYPLNDKWSEQSSNRIDFTLSEFQNGIQYKGSVVSNQLNGVSYILSQILQYQQNTGGYYNPAISYRKGNFVSIIHTGIDHPRQLETYICINDNMNLPTGELGIVGQNPVLGATPFVENGLTTYIGGYVNSQYWKRVDIGASKKIAEQSLTLPASKQSGSPFTYITELMKLPELTYSANDEYIKEVNSKLFVTTTLGTKSYIVEINLSAKYIRDDAVRKYLMHCDSFNMPVPDVSFGDVIWRDSNVNAGANNFEPSMGMAYCNVLSANANPSINDLLDGNVAPYGFNVLIGYTNLSGVRSWAVYLGFTEPNAKVKLSGESTIDVSLNSSVQANNIVMMNTIPVRPFGGKNGYNELGELREYDTPANTTHEVMLHYSKGEVELREAKTINTRGYGVYWILSRLQKLARPTLKEHTGRHTRAYGGATWGKDNSVYAGNSAGVLLEPGLPNIVGGFYVTNLSSVRGISNLFSYYRFGWKQTATNLGGQDTGFVFNAGNNQSIYQNGVYEADPNYYETPQSRFLDVRTKSIAIARYLKAF